MDSKRQSGPFRGLILSVFFGALLGTWFVSEPLLRFGSFLVHMGRTYSELLGVSLATGAGIGFLAYLITRPFPLRRHHAAPHITPVSLTAAVIGGLCIFWTLRTLSPSLAGLGSIRNYLILGALVGFLVFLIGLWIGSAAERGRGWARGLVTLALLGGPLLAGICGFVSYANQREVPIKPGDVSWAGGPKRIFLITIDALRADHVGCYGYERDTSPVIDRLASEGIRYTNAYSQGNRSEYSFGSLLTGLIPTAHGVRRDLGSASRLAEEATTIAEAMAQRGYTTIGLLTNPHIKHGFGLDQGLQVVDEFSYEYRKLLIFRLLEKLHLIREPEVDLATIPRGRDVTERALRLIDRHRDDPLFVFVHYMDVHHPYWPDPEQVEMFHRPTSSERSPVDIFVEITGRGQKSEVPGREPIPRADHDRLVDLYDGVIRYADKEIGILLDGLRERGLLEDCLIILTADHGDEFAEHGYYFHSNPVPSEILTRIPLILWSPDLVPGKTLIETPVSHVDVFPTLLALVGDTETGSGYGSPLPLTEPEFPDSTRWIASEGPLHASLRQIRHGRLYKLSWDKQQETAKLFDLEADSGEEHDLAADLPEIALPLTAELLGILQEARARAHEAGSTQVDSRTMEELRSLGYIGGPMEVGTGSDP